MGWYLDVLVAGRQSENSRLIYSLYQGYAGGGFCGCASISGGGSDGDPAGSAGMDGEREGVKDGERKKDGQKMERFCGGILLTGVGLAVCGCTAADPAKDHEQVSGRETMASEVLQTNESLSFSVPEPYYSLYEPL